MTGLAGALCGVRIVDLTTVVFGPYCTQILAELGADVIKVESPDGDSTRYIGAARHRGMGSIFLNLNRGKRSLCIDLKRTDGRAALLELAARSDVFIHAMRPAAIARLDLGPATMQALNPRLVYCAAIGYGSGGRHAGKPAYDDVIQAAAGLARLQGRGGDPQYCTTVVADKVAGLTAVYAVLAALLRRHATGAGAAIEVPMFETMASFVLAEHIGGHAFVPPSGPAAYARATTPYRRPYRTRNGFIAVIVYTDAQWSRFLTLVGRADLLTDPRFATFDSRTAHVDFLYRFIEDSLAARTTAEWLDALEAIDVPAMPVLTTEQLFEEPHLRDTGFFVAHDHPTEGALRLPRLPVAGDIAAVPARPAPRLGEHSVEVLREAGLAASAVNELLASGAIRDAAPVDQSIR